MGIFLKDKKGLLKSPLLAWAVCFVIFTTIFTQVDYRARENDSRLYTKDLIQLCERPLSEIVVLHWEATVYADPTSPYVRDHLIGQFVLPALMVKVGFPASHALYLFNNLIQIAIMYGLFYLAFLFVGKWYPDLLFFVGVLPQSWVYTLRSNHEQPLALMGILAMIAGIKMRDSRKWFILAIFSIVSAFLIKGMGFMMIPLAFVSGYFFSFELSRKRILELVLYALGVSIVLALVIWGYEAWFHSLTGESFFKRYWEIQIHGRTLKQDSGFSLVEKLKNFSYYFSRSLAYILPWPLFFIGVAIRKRSELQLWFGANRKWLLWLGGYTLLYMLVFSIFDRTASRYLFPNYYFVYLASSMALYRLKPTWSLGERSFFTFHTYRTHWIAAVIWLALHLLNLGKYVYKGGYGYWIK